jgi:hypothetical protein
MSGQGYAVMGTAVATGSNRAVDAANRAIASPLLEDNSIQGAQGILINICGSPSLTLHEVHEASSIIQKAAAENANIIFGAVQDETMKDAVKITVIAAGFKEANKKNTTQRPQFMPRTWKAGREEQTPASMAAAAGAAHPSGQGADEIQYGLAGRHDPVAANRTAEEDQRRGGAGLRRSCAERIFSPRPGLSPGGRCRLSLPGQQPTAA